MNTIELLKQIYAHDREVLYGHMHPDFKVHMAGQNPLAGTFHGREGFQEHIEMIQGLCNNSFSEELQDTFLANDSWGLVVHRMTAERNGKKLDTWGFGLWRFEDGLITDHWGHVGDQAHWDEFWS